jgi:ABC-2 type transport system permease protein
VDGILTFRARRPPFRAIGALVRRDLAVARSYRLSFYLDIALGVVDLCIYYFISKTFPHAISNLGGAPSYFAFALVGVAMTIVINSASTQLALRVREEQLTGTLEALTVQPLSGTTLALGLIGLPFILAMLRVALYLLAAGTLLGVDFSKADWPGFILVLLMSAVALSGIGIALGGLVLVIKRGAVVASLVIFLMGLLGGAFFPVAVLPQWLRPLAYIVPTRFAFDGLRDALYRGGGWGGDVAALAIIAAVSVPAAMWLFGAALRYGRRSGTLVQY